MSIRSRDTQELQSIRSKDKQSNLSHRVSFFFRTITILSLTVFSTELVHSRPSFYPERVDLLLHCPRLTLNSGSLLEWHAEDSGAQV